MKALTPDPCKEVLQKLIAKQSKAYIQNLKALLVLSELLLRAMQMMLHDI